MARKNTAVESSVERFVADFQRVNQEFDSIQVDEPVANDSADANGWATVGVDEFNSDLRSDGEMRKSKQANATRAHGGPATGYHSCAGQIIGHNADGKVNQSPLPAALVSCGLPVQCHIRNLTAS